MPDELERESPAVTAPEDVASVIDRWFRDHVQGSIVARDVDTYNYVLTAVEDLKRRLAAIGVK